MNAGSYFILRTKANLKILRCSIENLTIVVFKSEKQHW